MHIRDNIRLIKKRFQSLAAGLLVLLYIAGHVEFEAIHHELHGEEAHVTHTAADEQDACHVAIYHYSSESGCHHKAHITSEKKCPLCHLFNSVDKVVSQTTLSEKPFLKQESITWHSCIAAVANILHTPSRAPPVA